MLRAARESAKKVGTGVTIIGKRSSQPSLHPAASLHSQPPLDSSLLSPKSYSVVSTRNTSRMPASTLYPLRQQAFLHYNPSLPQQPNTTTGRAEWHPRRENTDDNGHVNAYRGHMSFALWTAQKALIGTPWEFTKEPEYTRIKYSAQIDREQVVNGEALATEAARGKKGKGDPKRVLVSASLMVGDTVTTIADFIFRKEKRRSNFGATIGHVIAREVPEPLLSKLHKQQERPATSLSELFFGNIVDQMIKGTGEQTFAASTEVLSLQPIQMQDDFTIIGGVHEDANPKNPQEMSMARFVVWAAAVGPSGNIYQIWRQPQRIVTTQPDPKGSGTVTRVKKEDELSKTFKEQFELYRIDPKKVAPYEELLQGYRNLIAHGVPVQQESVGQSR